MHILQLDFHYYQFYYNFALLFTFGQPAYVETRKCIHFHTTYNPVQANTSYIVLQNFITHNREKQTTLGGS